MKHLWYFLRGLFEWLAFPTFVGVAVLYIVLMFGFFGFVLQVITLVPVALGILFAIYMTGRNAVEESAPPKRNINW